MSNVKRHKGLVKRLAAALSVDIVDSRNSIENILPDDVLDFGQALLLLKAGKSVARRGWNGKNMMLFMIDGPNNIAKLHGFGFGEMLGEPTFQDTIYLRTVANQLVAWCPTQTDVLANDWVVVVKNE